MRIYLSSQDFGDYVDELLKLVGSNKKVVFINNAKDDLPKEEKDLSTAGKKDMFENIGFKFKEVDLRNYFGNNKLAEEISDAGLIWASGGNTFILRRAMAAS